MAEDLGLRAVEYFKGKYQAMKGGRYSAQVYSDLHRACLHPVDAVSLIKLIVKRVKARPADPALPMPAVGAASADGL